MLVRRHMYVDELVQIKISLLEFVCEFLFIVQTILASMGECHSTDVSLNFESIGNIIVEITMPMKFIRSYFVFTLMYVDLVLQRCAHG